MFRRILVFCERSGWAINNVFSRSPFVAGLSIFFLLTFLAVAALVDVSIFSPDSWAYYELAKTFRGDAFYRVNTFRSYFSLDRSAAFPFGWPLTLAAVGGVVGLNPATAVYVNCLLSVMLVPLVFALTATWRLPPIASLLMVASVLSYGPYLDEVFGGRAMPLAMLLFLSALYLYRCGRFVLCGVLAGLASLARFDFLGFAICGLLFHLFSARSLKPLVKLSLGLCIGMTPWIAFSLSHFGRLWVSDNGWVAMSATSAFNLDFPPSSALTVREAPALWLTRVASNISPLVGALLGASLAWLPALPMLTLIAMVRNDRLCPAVRAKLASFVVTWTLSMTPYLLTGYFDARYFALPFFLLQLALVVWLFFDTGGWRQSSSVGAVAVVLFPTVACGVMALGNALISASAKQPSEGKAKAMVLQAYSCHLSEPGRRFIFGGELAFIAPRYGALTGLPTAFLPSNYKEMSEGARASYLSAMTPYRLMLTARDIDQCHQDSRRSNSKADER